MSFGCVGGERELGFLTTVAISCTATDIALANLTIEAFYPADPQTANTLLAKGSGRVS